MPAGDPAAIDAVTAFVTGEVGGTGSDDGVFAATFRRLASGSDPRLRLFGGWVDGRLVASAGLFSGAAVAGIVAVMTIPSMRGRGIGAAMTRATMDAARTLGFDTAILRASPMGEALYRRLGFREVGRIVHLHWPGVGGHRRRRRRTVTRRPPRRSSPGRDHGCRHRRYIRRVIIRVLTATVPERNSAQLHELMRRQLPVAARARWARVREARATPDRPAGGGRPHRGVAGPDGDVSVDRTRMSRPRLLPGAEELITDLLITHYEALDIDPSE